MAATDTLINDVSDTSLWVAHYRAKESKRPDALFKDPLAEVLMGERGQKIAADMKVMNRHAEWSVIMRTVVIDNYIQKMVQEGIDTVLNLGAGMDTRPYRMALPATLKWIEVDYAHLITPKNKLLENVQPKCQLKRVALDLADDQKRTAFLQQIASQSKKILVLTEGVVFYLTEDQVAALAGDLAALPTVHYWVVEYLNPEAYPYLKNRFSAGKLKHAPFRFFPVDWLGFFSQKGWTPKELTYLGEIGDTLGRPMPAPPVGFFIKLFARKAVLEKAKKMTGFLLLKKKN